MSPIETLLRLLLTARSWPIAQEYRLRERLALWIALRESQIEVLRQVAKWQADRLYVIDNLPQKIAEAYGSLMWGQDPEVKAAAEADQDRLVDELWDGNDAPSGLQAAEETCVSEGETWYRISRHPAITHPVLSWHSRWDVVPLLHGREVVACAFVSRYADPAEKDGGRTGVVYRHLEMHEQGRVLNVLFRGRDGALGHRVDLGKHPRTAGLMEDWRHELPAMLAGRIVNRWGRDNLAGRSIYEGIWRQFLVLNEATTIGRENMRLTAKKRAVVPASALRQPPPVDTVEGAPPPAPEVARPRAQVEVGEEFFIADPLDVTEGEPGSAGGGGNPFRVLEYSFDAEALIAYVEHLISTIAQRCDLVPQFMGRGDFGLGASGTALRVRLLPTLNAIEGRARPWDDGLPGIVRSMQLLDSAPVPAGGLAAPWTEPEGVPTIDRDVQLPEDPTERDGRHSTLKTSGLISTETSLRERYPGREDQWYTDEVDRIRSDEAASMPAATFGGGPPPPGGQGE